MPSLKTIDGNTDWGRIVRKHVHKAGKDNFNDHRFTQSVARVGKATLPTVGRTAAAKVLVRRARKRILDAGANHRLALSGTICGPATINDSRHPWPSNGSQATCTPRGWRSNAG